MSCNCFSKSIYINHSDSNKTLLDAYKEKKPSHVLLMLGTNSVATMDTNYFIAQYKKLLQDMINSNPEGVIIVQSIFPVAKEYDENNLELFEKLINRVIVESPQRRYKKVNVNISYKFSK